MTTSGHHQQRRIDVPKAFFLMVWALLSNPLLLIPPLVFLALAFGLHYVSLNLDQMLLGIGAIPEPLTERQVVGVWMLRVTPFGPLVFIIPLFILSACVVAKEIEQSRRVTLFQALRSLTAHAFRAIAIAIMTFLRALPTGAVLAGCAVGVIHFRGVLGPLMERNVEGAVLGGSVAAVILFLVTAQILITPFVALAGNLSAREAHSTSRFVISRRFGGLLLLLSGVSLAGYYFAIHRAQLVGSVADPLLKTYAEIAIASGIAWLASGITYLLCVGALDEITTSHLQALRAHSPTPFSPLVERQAPSVPSALSPDFLVERDQSESSPPRAFPRRGSQRYFPQISARNPSRPEPTR